MFSIGQFQCIDDLEFALKSAKNGKLTLGPGGGFRGFIITINCYEKEYLFELFKGETLAWQILSTFLNKHMVKFDTEKIS